MEGIEGNGFVPIIAQASWFFHLHDRMILCFPRHANTEFHRDSEDSSCRNLYGLIRGFSL